MKVSAAALSEVVIIAAPKVKETETALIEEAKEAVVITQTIGSQELSKKGVSNAEGAVTKVAGITKSQGSKSVFVRGLGDRYNSTTLNGLPLPSDDPESKNISLDFFSSNVISNIGVNKTFNPSIYGDVGGANIDIKSKVVSKNTLSVSSSLGVNTRAFNKAFLRVGGANDYGTGIEEISPITDPSLSTYNFDNPLQPGVDNAPWNTSLSLVGATKFTLGGVKVSAFAVGSNKSSYKYKEGVNASINAVGDIIRDQTAKKYDYNVAQLVMGGVNFAYSGGNNVSLTHLYIHNNTQSVGEYEGVNTSVIDDQSVPVFTRRQQVNDNDLYVTQINGNQKITDRLELIYGGAFNYIEANEPDRRTNTAFYDADTNTYLPAQGTAGFNHRFYSELQEDDFAARAELKYDLNNDTDFDFVREIKGGYNFRYTNRNFIFRQFSANILNQGAIDLTNVDAYFNQETLNNGDFELQTDAGTRYDSLGRLVSPLYPFFYYGDRLTNSFFLDGVYQFNERLTVNGGLRYDKIDQQVDYDTALVSSVNTANPDDSVVFEKEYLLPSFNVKYQPNEEWVFRTAGSISYTLPQLRELAPFVYEGVNFTTIGETSLNPSKNYHFDAKSEYYFGEDGNNLVTLTGFYKYIDLPINRVNSNSAGSFLTYVNVPEAQVLGAEVEVKADVYRNEDFENNNEEILSVGFNGSYLYSQQVQEDIDSDDVTVRFTNSSDKLQGASPILLNANVTYNLKKDDKIDFTSSLVGGYFSERIYAVGVAGSENVVESDIITLDFINKLKLNKDIGISFSLKNILDPSIELTQEAQGKDVVLNSYKRGMDISLGFSYQF